MRHSWRCWFRGWSYVTTSRGAWLSRTCRRCGQRKRSILGIFVERYGKPCK